MNKNRVSIQKQKKAENPQLTLYEINQQIISGFPAYNDEQINKLIDSIDTWNKTEQIHTKYYMLLNNEKHYYTVIKYEAHVLPTHFSTLGKAVVFLLKEIGYDILEEECTGDHYEIWVKDDKETLCYLLFPYDQGVVTYG